MQASSDVSLQFSRVTVLPNVRLTLSSGLKSEGAAEAARSSHWVPRLGFSRTNLQTTSLNAITFRNFPQLSAPFRMIFDRPLILLLNPAPTAYNHHNPVNPR